MQAMGFLCIKGWLFVVSFPTSELSPKLRFTPTPSVSRAKLLLFWNLRDRLHHSQDSSKYFQKHSQHVSDYSCRDRFYAVWLIFLFIFSCYTNFLHVSLSLWSLTTTFSKLWHPPPQGVWTGIFLKELSYNTHCITKSWLAWEHLAILDNLWTDIVITKRWYNC